MNKLLLVLIIGLCYTPAFGQYNFTLKISSKTLSDKKIYLNIFNNYNYDPIQRDSFLFKNDSQKINGSVAQPSNFAELYVLDNSTYISARFVLDTGENKLSLELPAEQSRYLKLTSDARGNYIFDEMQKISTEIVNHYPNSRRANGTLNMSSELLAKITQSQLKDLETHPNDFGSLIYLYHISRMSTDPNDALKVLATLNTFSDDIKNSPTGKQLYLEEKSLINNKLKAEAGKKAVIFHVKDIHSRPFSNSSLAGQNYMIVFSATWCGPCQEELPKLKELYRGYKEKGLKVIYFNNDDNIARWKEHVSQNKLAWINVSERLKPGKSKIQNSFGVYAIPTCLLVNKDGVIIYNSDQIDPGIDQIESYLKKLLD